MRDVLNSIEFKLNTSSFQYFNANPEGNNTDDCVVRAISAATNQSWEDTLMGLTECAIKYKLMIHDPKLYDKYLNEIGWQKQKQPRKRNNKKYTGKEWVKKFDGDAIAHVGTFHIVYITHNHIFDTWDSSDGYVGNYWIKIK